MQEAKMASGTYQLVMRTGPNPGKTYELSQDEISVGRDIANNIVVNDPEVSRRHARFRLQAGNYILEDLGSTNGTFVNGQRLMGPHGMRPGEQIMFGDHVAFAYEAMQFDPNATVVSSSQYPQETYRVPEEMVPPTAPTPSAAGYQPVYSGQAPMGPAEPYAQSDMSYLSDYTEEPKRSRTWIYIGAGCLVVLLCLCVVGGYVFDSLDLYCKAPFRTLIEAAGFVCQ
jgi:predicted component of type VI protein secretion system